MQIRRAEHIEKFLTGSLTAALAALVLAVFVLCTAPPVDRDALTHHLAVPKLYLQQGGIYEIPHVPFSYYPMNLDLLYMIPLCFGNDIFPKYIHFAFALLTAASIFCYLLRRFGSAVSALLGGLLFLSLPVIIKLSITVYVDLGLIFFSTASLLQLLRWAETGFRPRHLVLGGVLAGLCLGTKPNGMLAFFFLAAVIPFLYLPEFGSQGLPHGHVQRRHPRGGEALRLLAWSAAFVVIAMTVYSPWMLRNYTWTGNPVYPMAVNIFGPSDPMNDKSPAVEKEAPAGAGNQETSRGDSEFGHFAVRKLIFGESLLEILTIPVRIFFQGEDDNPRLFDGRLNPYLLVFPLLAVFAAHRQRRLTRQQLENRVMGMFSLFYLSFAFFLVDMRIRYIGPIIPPLVILTVTGLRDLVDIIKARFLARNQLLALSILGLALLGLLGMNAAYLADQFRILDPLGYLSGRLSRDQYILKHRPEYAAISFANRDLPEGARILALFNGNRIYYSNREMICDTGLFHRAVLDSRSSEDLRQHLKKAGFSHLLVRLDLFDQWAGSQFKADAKSILQSFFMEGVPALYQGYGYGLFALTAG